MDNKQLIAMVLGIAAVGAVPKAVSAGQESYFSELWGEKGERWDPLGRLPDFSYAGYHTGEKPIPDVPVRGNVKDFGAKGDGEADDTQAFKDAIAASEGGAILIPAGRYVISDFLRIKRSNLVLRGAGRDKTTLFFPKTIKELQGEVGYYDGLIRPEGDNKGAQLTDVAEGAKRGDTTLAVKSTAGIRSGQMIRLRMYNPISGEAPEYIDLPATIRNRVKATDPTYNSFGKYIYGDGSYGLNPERRGWFGGADVDWVVKVESVRGNTIKLARPLRLDVRLEWKPEIWSHAPTLQEVGFEDFGIEFPDIQYNGHQQGQGCHAFYVLGAYNC
nr:hypothetical protein [Anaerolineales bacterium]